MFGKTHEIPKVPKREIKSLEELHIFAEEFLRKVLSRPTKNSATLVLLSGELGSGKTAFTKEVANLLGIEETITSPTFILEKIYPIPAGSLAEGRFTTLIHIDAYRLEKPEELKALDLDTLVTNPKNLIFFEWPERGGALLPADAIKFSFEYVNESVRSVSGADV